MCTHFSLNSLVRSFLFFSCTQDHELSLMFFHTTAPFPLHVGNLFGVDKLDFNNFSNDPHNFNNNNYSGFVWPSAVVLSAFISRNPHLFRDKTVLELGSGTGICGIQCAVIAGAKQVWLTDYDDSYDYYYSKKSSNINNTDNSTQSTTQHPRSILEKLTDKVSQQISGDTTNKLSATLKVRKLNWGDIVATSASAAVNPNNNDNDNSAIISDTVPDIVIAADLFYDVYDFANILSTVYYFLFSSSASSNNPCFLVAFEERSDQLVMELMVLLEEWCLTITELTDQLDTLCGGDNDSDYQSLLQGKTIRIFCIQKK